MSTALDTDTMVRLKTPSLYKVVLLNDDYTPMDFVIQILVEIFHKSPQEAYQLTMDVHEKGRGIAGTYSREVANQKSQDCDALARNYKHPFKAIVERA